MTLAQSKNARRGDACGVKLVVFDDQSRKWYTMFCSLRWDHGGKHEIRVVW